MSLFSTIETGFVIRWPFAAFAFFFGFVSGGWFGGDNIGCMLRRFFLFAILTFRDASSNIFGLKLLGIIGGEEVFLDVFIGIGEG